MATALVFADSSINMDILRELLAREGIDSVALMPPTSANSPHCPANQRPEAAQAPPPGGANVTCSSGGDAPYKSLED
jgi:hypothetical protein